jgi:methyl-accepting chemotaxis protein
MNKMHSIKRRDEEIKDLKSEMDEIKKILNVILERI